MMTIDATDRGFLLGDGVFDTFSVIGGKPLQRDRHNLRLLQHAAHIGLVFQPEQLVRLQDQQLKTITGNAVVRTTLTRGHAKRGLWPVQEPSAPTCSIIVSPMHQQAEGQTLRATWASLRRNDTSLLSQIKSLSYLESILALREAHEKGYNEALFLNTRGYVTCSTSANIFIQEENRLITPRREDGVLDGITRNLLLENPPEGMAVHEESITSERLLAAEAVLLTNSVTRIRSVSSINNVEKNSPPWLVGWNNKQAFYP
jgi:branched-chain amino acid aminotransferase